MKRIEDFTVIGHHWLNYENFLIELEAPEELPDIRAGNFAEVLLKNSPGTFLRRPFSIFEVDKEKNSLTFYIKVIGKGTRYLGKLRKGEKLNIIYPLGNAFSNPYHDKVLMVGGGSGIAPFVLLGRQLREKGIRMTFLFGGREKDNILMTERFEEFGKVFVTTEDGSVGEKGLVTQHSILAKRPLEYGMIYTCGPDPMMKAIAHIAKQHQIPCEVSLENTMACGIGACLCCIVETNTGNKCVCTDGPVFNVNDLTWQT